eukprot:scaffold191999_cov45-Attheya_sp.AAC.3
METAVATLPKVVPEKSGQQTNLRSSDDTPDKETPQSPSTTTIENRNLERTATHRTAETGTELNSRMTSSTFRSRVTGNSNAHTIRTPSRAE